MHSPYKRSMESVGREAESGMIISTEQGLDAVRTTALKKRPGAYLLAKRPRLVSDETAQVFSGMHVGHSSSVRRRRGPATVTVIATKWPPRKKLDSWHEAHEPFTEMEWHEQWAPGQAMFCIAPTNTFQDTFSIPPAVIDEGTRHAATPACKLLSAPQLNAVFHDLEDGALVPPKYPEIEFVGVAVGASLTNRPGHYEVELVVDGGETRLANYWGSEAVTGATVGFIVGRLRRDDHILGGPMAITAWASTFRRRPALKAGETFFPVGTVQMGCTNEVEEFRSMVQKRERRWTSDERLGRYANDEIDLDRRFRAWVRVGEYITVALYRDL